jgi:hypothetical protein
LLLLSEMMQKLILFFMFVCQMSLVQAQDEGFNLIGRGIRDQRHGDVLGIYSNGDLIKWKLYSEDGRLIRESEKAQAISWDSMLSAEQSMNNAIYEMSGRLDQYFREAKKCMHHAGIYSFKEPNLNRLTRQYAKVHDEIRENKDRYPLLADLTGIRWIRGDQDGDFIKTGIIVEAVYGYSKPYKGAYKSKVKTPLSDQDSWNWSIIPEDVKHSTFSRFIYQMIFLEEISKL